MRPACVWFFLPCIQLGRIQNSHKIDEQLVFLLPFFARYSYFYSGSPLLADFFDRITPLICFVWVFFLSASSGLLLNSTVFAVQRAVSLFHLSTTFLCICLNWKLHRFFLSSKDFECRAQIFPFFLFLSSSSGRCRMFPPPTNPRLFLYLGNLSLRLRGCHKQTPTFS